MDIAGRTAIVTGAGSGLGQATAIELAKQGAKIVAIDIHQDKAKETAANTKGMAVTLNVADGSAAEKAFASLFPKLATPSILVNCAGIAPASRIVGRDGPMALAQFSETIEVNLIGSFNMLRLAAASMMSQPPNDDGERGVIINTASVAAFEGQIGQAAYAASKRADTACCP